MIIKLLKRICDILSVIALTLLVMLGFMVSDAFSYGGPTHSDPQVPLSVTENIGNWPEATTNKPVGPYNHAPYNPVPLPPDDIINEKYNEFKELSSDNLNAPDSWTEINLLESKIKVLESQVKDLYKMVRAQDEITIYLLNRIHNLRKQMKEFHPIDNPKED